jgi:tetratricopeptide (TPR) repeat protein
MLSQKTCFHKLLEVESYKERGDRLLREGRYQEAETAYQEALQQAPDDHELLANLSTALLAMGRVGEAFQQLEIALHLSPGEVDLHYNLGNAFIKANEPEKAECAYRRALALVPTHFEALNNLGLLLKKKGALEEAAAFFKKGIENAPLRPEGYLNLSSLLYDAQIYSEAEAIARRGIDAIPRSANLHYNLGNILKSRGELEKSTLSFDSAIALSPDYAEAHWNKALNHLVLGDYIVGWREYEWRLRKNDWNLYYPYPIGSPLWRGEDLSEKTLFIHDEQGYGDTIQFSRYLKLVRPFCKRLIFETRRPLTPLFSKWPQIDVLIERPAKLNAHEKWDFHLPLLSLPHMLGTSVDTIPDSTPYIVPDKVLVDRFADCIDPCKLNVGIVWAGNPRHGNDTARSMQFEDFVPILNCAHVGYHSLQKGGGVEKIGQAPQWRQIIKFWHHELSSFGHTAALIWNLDLVISVDTAVAHLSAAMGKSCWLLLPEKGVDWRWTSDTITKSWYPTITRMPQSKLISRFSTLIHPLESR